MGLAKILFGPDSEDINEELNLYYTDRYGDFQFGTDKSRVEFTIKENTTIEGIPSKTLTMSRLPEGRRYVQKDLVGIDEEDKRKLSTLYNYAMNELPITVKMTAEGGGKKNFSKNPTLTDCFIVADGQNVEKAYVLVDNNGETWAFRIISKMDELVFCEMACGEDAIYSFLTDDEMKNSVHLPAFVSMSPCEINLYRFLVDFMETNTTSIEVHGLLYK